MGFLTSCVSVFGDYGFCADTSWYAAGVKILHWLYLTDDCHGLTRSE